MLTKSVLFLLCKRSIVILQPQFVVYLSVIQAYQSWFHLRSFYTSYTSSLSEELHCYVRRLLLEIKVTNDSSRNHFQNRCTKRQAINSRVMPYSDSYRIHEIHRYNNLYITEVVCALMVYYCNEHYGIRYAALSLEKYYFLLELIRQIDALWNGSIF